MASSSAPKSEGRPFADHVRGAEELKAALIWLYDCDSAQLTGYLRSGPSSGRLKLLLACARAVCEPAAPGPSTSTDGPKAAQASQEAATSPGDAAPGKSTSPGSTPPTTGDPVKKAVEPEPEGAGDTTSTQVADAPPEVPVTSDGQDTMEPPTTSNDGGTAEAATSVPPGHATPGERPSRFEHIAPPSFVDSSEVPRKAKVSTRQLLCCREPCAICYQACCGYASELPQDTHFIASDVYHRCKQCYRASRIKANEATTSTHSTSDTAQDTQDWYHTSDSTGSWQQSPSWSSGHWEWDAWHQQWSWH